MQFNFQMCKQKQETGHTEKRSFSIFTRKHPVEAKQAPAPWPAATSSSSLPIFLVASLFVILNVILFLLLG
jgi:hypothetical protein